MRTRTLRRPRLRPANLNVVLVFLESTYNKHLSLFGSDEPTEPLLSAYRDRMELFPNFFSDFAGSIYARFATFTSLYPVRDYNAFTLHRVEVKSLFEVLHERGYTCSMFYSSFFDYTGFGDFLRQRGIDDLFDADSMPGTQGAERVSWGVREEDTLGAMRAQIKKYAADGRRFFLTYVPAAPHYPYDKIPPQFCKYKMTEVGNFTPLYQNELLYIDWVLASMVDQLKASGVLDKTLVIITNDHGEMLGDNGGPIGHGWVVTPELVNTPLILMDPQNPGCHTNYTVGSQIDLLPTVLDRLNIPLPRDQLYQGRSLALPPDPESRLTYLNTLQQYGALWGNHLLVGNPPYGHSQATAPAGTIFTLSNEGAKTLFAADPGAWFPPVSIEKFETFQENFLRNYSFYCESLCDRKGPIASR